MNQWQKTVLMLIIGFVVGFGVGWLSFGGRASSDEENLKKPEVDSVSFDEAINTSDRQEVSDVFVDEELVQVKDQQAGPSVFVTRVALEAPGWVAIHEDHGGLPGNVLGAHRFDVGVYQGTVTLLRNTETGNKYHAMLWRDNGDGIFDLESDTVISGVSPMVFEAY